MEKLGRIGWIDLTVPGVDMGGYQDYCMVPNGAQEPVAGICHSRGANAALPPVWLIYISVSDMEESIRRCLERGGKLRTQIQSMGSQGRYCVIEDPAGAVSALFEPSKQM